MSADNVTPPVPDNAPDGWYLLDASLDLLGGPFPTLLEAREAGDRLEASGLTAEAFVQHRRQVLP